MAVTAPTTDVPKTFHNFLKLPVEIREEIWATTLATPWTPGPGLWRYQPGCWQGRSQLELELDSCTFEANPLRGNIFEPFWLDDYDWDENPDTIVFADWLLSSNTLPRTAVPFVSHEAHDAALRYYAKRDGGVMHNNSPRKVSGPFPWSVEEDSSLNEPHGKQNLIHSERVQFSSERDALYIPPESWANCNSTLEATVRRIEEFFEPSADQEDIYCHRNIKRVAVSLECLSSRLVDIQRFSVSLEGVEELLVVVGDVLPPPVHGQGKKGTNEDHRVWWEFRDARKGRFVWEHDGDEFDSQCWFGFHHDKDVDVPDDELCALIQGLTEDLKRSLEFTDLFPNCRTQFQIRPVVAVAREWS